MSLHLSELKKNWERPCSPLGSGLLGEIRQLRPSPSTYSGETEVSGGGIHSLLFLFSLKAADKSSCYIHPPVLQDAATFRAHMDARESKLSSDQTERTGTMASPPFSSVTCSSMYSLNAPIPFLLWVLALLFPLLGHTSPNLPQASLAHPQQASPSRSDTPSEEAPPTGLVSNLHSTLRSIRTPWFFLFLTSNSISYFLFV